MDHFLKLFFTSDLANRKIPAKLEKYLVNLNTHGSKYQITFNTAKILPNSCQFAIAQHSVLRMALNPRKNIVWNIASGRGKSRVINSLILIFCV